MSFIKNLKLDQGLATVFAALIAVIGISYQLHENRQAEILKDKKEAYLLAFESINDVLGNMSITPDGGTYECPPSNPHSYNLTQVRVVMDRLLVFSGKPIESVKAYQQAIGIQSNTPVRALSDFRSIAMRDLGQDSVADDAFLRVNGWIAAVPHPATIAMQECVTAQRKARKQNP